MRTVISWQENGQTHHATWLADSRSKPPEHIVPIAQIGADEALAMMHQNTALLWRGDYHQAKQLLSAIKKRVHGKSKAAADFHRHRLQQTQRSQLFQRLLLLIEPGWTLTNRRAPDIRAALMDVHGQANTEPLLLPLHILLGYIGAHEWHKQGIPIAALGGASIHVPYGVFSPLRGEYLSLVANAPLPEPCNSAWDIGTGSGVLAAILAKRGIPHIIGTDTNPRAITTARANIQRLGLAENIRIEATDLLPGGSADLVVCNPPWLPTKPTADIETALYDPGHAMLHALLQHTAEHLNPNGQLWLIMSDLAEHLSLRQPQDLSQWISAAGWHIIDKHDTRPTHNKVQRTHDPLHLARSREITSLWRLTRR